MSIVEQAFLKSAQRPTAVLKTGRSYILSGANRPKMFMEGRFVDSGLRAPLNAPAVASGDTNESGPSGTFYLMIRWGRKHGLVYSNPSPLARKSDGARSIAVNGKNLTVTVTEQPADPSDFWQLMVMEAQENIWHPVADVPIGEESFTYELDNFTLQAQRSLFIPGPFQMGALDNHIPPACKYGAEWIGRLWTAGMDNVTLDTSNAGEFRVVNQWFDRDALDEGPVVQVAQDVTIEKRGDEDSEVFYVDNAGNSYTFNCVTRPSNAGLAVGDVVNILSSGLAEVETNATGMTITAISNDEDEPTLTATAIGALVAAADADDWESAGFSKPPEIPERQIRGVVILDPEDQDGHFNGSETYKGLKIDEEDKQYTADVHLDYRRLRLTDKYVDSRTTLDLTLETRSVGGEDVYFVFVSDGTYTFYTTTSPQTAGITAGSIVDIVTIETTDGTRPVAVEQAVVRCEVTAVGDVDGSEFVTLEIVDAAQVTIASISTTWAGSGIAIAEAAKTGELFGQAWLFSSRLDVDGFNDEANPPLNFEFPEILKGHMPVGMAVSGDALVVFTENEIGVARGNPGLGRIPVFWDERRLNVGLAAPHTLVTVSKKIDNVRMGDLLFIGSGGRLMRYTGGILVDESRRLGVQEFLSSITDTSWANTVAEWDSNRSWYILKNFDPSGDAGNMSYAFIWDVANDAFLVMKDAQSTALGIISDSNGADQLIYGNDLGFIGVDNIEGVVNRDVLVESERQGGTKTIDLSARWVAGDTIAANGFTLESGTPFPTTGDGLKGVYLHHRVVVDEGAQGTIYTHRILSNTSNSIVLDAVWIDGSKPLPDKGGDIWYVGGIHIEWTSGIMAGRDLGDKQLKAYGLRIAGPTDELFAMRLSFFLPNAERTIGTILVGTRTDSWFDKDVSDARGILLAGGISSEFVFQLEGVLQDDDLTITLLRIAYDVIRGELAP